MRVILDTNVLLSAFMRVDSNPYEVVQAWIDGPRDRPLVIDAKIAKFPSWLMARRHRQPAEDGEPVRISH